VRYLLPLACAGGLAGCGLVYTDVRYARAYRASSPADLATSRADRTVTGTACSRSALFLAAWGDAGYAAAVKDALKEDPQALLYDVRADFQAKSILAGLYTRVCTVVTGRVAYP